MRPPATCASEPARSGWSEKLSGRWRWWRRRATAALPRHGLAGLPHAHHRQDRQSDARDDLEVAAPLERVADRDAERRLTRQSDPADDVEEHCERAEASD